MADQHAVELCGLVDEQCDVFEDAWDCANQPAIGDFLAAVPQEVREDLFGKLLAVEIELIVRSEKWPDAATYQDQYPAYAAIIERAFAELHTWVRVTEVIDAGLKSRVAQRDQDTERLALETEDWSPEDLESSDPKTSTEPTADRKIPSQVGRYTVLKKLGHGGMGTVLLTHDTVLDREVALKLPHFDTRDQAEAIERFFREARAMATVHHPNLCPIFDAGEHDGQAYLTMAYIDGHSLAEGIDADGPIEASEAAQLVWKLASAVHAVHEAGVVHRDLKPSNVMVDQNGEPFITDFGLASRDRPTEPELTHSGTLIGSPAYMAPEQVSSRHGAVGPQTDVYALGVILYQLLCGRRPYEGVGLAVLGDITSAQEPKRPSTLADVDEQLEAICLKAMARDIKDRFRSAAELAEALHAYLGHDPTRRPRIDALEVKKELVRRWLLGCIAFVLIAGITGGFAFKGRLRPRKETDLSHMSVIDSVSVGNDHNGIALPDAAEPAARRLPPQPAPSKRSTGRFYDSGQELGRGRSRAVRLGDLDSDGDLDAFVINRYEEPNRVWLNNGKGMFFDSGQCLGSSYSWDLAMGDVDDDSDLDTVVLNVKGQPSRVWLNDGHGNFEASLHTIRSVDAHAIGLADLDADGDLDVMVGDNGANHVWLNDGNGRFADSGQRLGDARTWCLALGDVNGDGSVDAFAGNGGISSQPNSVWLNDGRGYFNDSAQSLGDSTSIGVALADLNGDGCLDAFVANDGNQPNCIWLNDGHGRFDGSRQHGVMNSIHVALGDLDGDGDMDALVANGRNQPNLLLLNDGKAEFVPGPVSWLGNWSSSGSALGDLDGDGELDAFVTNFQSQPNRVWFNQDIDESVASP